MKSPSLKKIWDASHQASQFGFEHICLISSWLYYFPLPEHGVLFVNSNKLNVASFRIPFYLQGNAKE